MEINKKIIFISATPTSKIHGDKLDPYRFISLGIDVEYWNISSIYYSQKQLDLYFGGHPEYRYIFPNEKNFQDINSVKKELKKDYSNTLFCFVDFFQQPTLWLLRSFKKNNIHYFVGPRRTPYAHETNTDSLLKQAFDAILDGTFFKKLTPSVESSINNILLHQLKLFAYRNTNYYKKPDFVIGSGSVGRMIWCNKTAINNFISVKSTDVCWDEKLNLIKKKFCVYVDESIIYSPDRGLYEPNKKNSASNDFESFVSNMCHVFNVIEKKLGLEVIIASSGKFKYKNEKLYGGRMMIYGKTNQLIQHTELALGHTSSGLYQAIINRKPIILLRDPSFSDYKNFHINSFSTFLKVKQVNTINFSDKDLSSENDNLQHHIELEEQYFKEKGSIDSYHEVIQDYFEKMQ
jgi:hypothetical protein